ncbi:MAG: alpha/beta hydrolase [Deltaproteobacteria bacterium]|nr:alpha/beta hydrolase [Deltaproteobacteria bacterium]
MASTSVSFRNSSGFTLAGRLDLPDAGEPDAWAIFCHCFTCNKNFKAAFHVGRALTERGFGLLRFDFPGTGESEGDLADATLSSNVDDVVRAAQFLASRGTPPALLIGHSLGGAAVIRAAPRIASTRAVVVLGTPAEPRELAPPLRRARDVARAEGSAEAEIAGRTVLLKQGFFDDLETSRLSDSLRALKVPLLILHSPADEVCPFENAERLFREAPPPRSLISLPGADHLLSRREDAAYAGSLVAAWAGPLVRRPSSP